MIHENVISKIEDTSPLRPWAHIGDRVVSINGNEVRDVLDYKFYAYDTELSIVLLTPEGRSHTVHISKAEGEDLGLEFESYLMDRPRSCANRCVF